jgi:phage shock protein C
MSEPVKRLYRSQVDSRIAGVCGGLGIYLGIDPVVVRLLWVAITCLTGFFPGIVVYLIAWLIMPLRPGSAAATESSHPSTQPTPDHTP